MSSKYHIEQTLTLTRALPSILSGSPVQVIHIRETAEGYQYLVMPTEYVTIGRWALENELERVGAKVEEGIH